MSFSLVRRRVYCWIACFAILLNALAPAVSQAVAASQGQTGWTQICSLAGLRWVQVDEFANSQEDGDSGQTDQASQCPFCGLHAGSFIALPPVFGAIAVPVAHHGAPISVVPDAQPFRPWTVAHPRAPPALS